MPFPKFMNEEGREARCEAGVSVPRERARQVSGRRRAAGGLQSSGARAGTACLGAQTLKSSTARSLARSLAPIGLLNESAGKHTGGAPEPSSRLHCRGVTADGKKGEKAVLSPLSITATSAFQ